MATINRFEDLLSWQKSRELCREVYDVSCNGKFSKDFALRDQIRSAVGSVMDNIAEGFERNGKNEFIQFLAIAKGSAGEVRSQVHRAMDVGYLTKDQFDDLQKRCLEISSMISKFISYLKSSLLKGSKFNKRSD